jgi:hypothetical protein
MTKDSEKLRDNPIWKDMFALAEHIYDRLDKESEGFPDTEEWNTRSKIRNSVNDAMFYVSMALGSRAPGGNEYEWNNAKKHMSGLLSMYLFAGRRRFLRLDPEVVVKIEGLIETIQTNIDAARDSAKKREQEELEPWLERYRLWEKINGKESDKAK